MVLTVRVLKLRGTIRQLFWVHFRKQANAQLCEACSTECDIDEATLKRRQKRGLVRNLAVAPQETLSQSAGPCNASTQRKGSRTCGDADERDVRAPGDASGEMRSITSTS